jgi:hypothetical protein
MDNPWLFPKARVDFIEESSPFHGMPELSFEDERQRFGMNKEVLS